MRAPQPMTLAAGAGVLAAVAIAAPAAAAKLATSVAFGVTATVPSAPAVARERAIRLARPAVARERAIRLARPVAFELTVTPGDRFTTAAEAT